MYAPLGGIGVAVALSVLVAVGATDKCDEPEKPEAKQGTVKSPEVMARQLEVVRAQVAGRIGALDTNDVGAAMIAAALVNKNVDASDAQGMGRLTEAYAFYKPLVPIIRAANVPDEFKRLLECYYASIVVFPIRQGLWGMDAVGEGQRIAAIPAGGTLVTIGPGDTVTANLERIVPGWSQLSPVRRKVLMDYLDAINPHISFEHMYRADAAAVKGGVFTCELMENVLRPQMYGILESINPSLSPFPPQAPDRKGRGECLAVPLGRTDVAVSCYRVEPSAKVFLPPAGHLAAMADPEVLDLRNTWLKDLSGLAGMHPKSLDLAGCMVTNISALSSMTSLTTLRLTGNPVCDLSPLKGLKIRDLDLGRTQVKDLSALSGMPLERLVLDGSKVTDIGILGKIGTMRKLEINRTAVTNLAPLTGLPLEYLTLAQAGAYADFAPIKRIETLKTIGDVPLDRWITENEFLRKRNADLSAGTVSVKSGKTAAKSSAKLPPPSKKSKDEEPPDAIPAIDLNQ